MNRVQALAEVAFLRETGGNAWETPPKWSLGKGPKKRKSPKPGYYNGCSLVLDSVFSEPWLEVDGEKICRLSQAATVYRKWPQPVEEPISHWLVADCLQIETPRSAPELPFLENVPGFWGIPKYVLLRSVANITNWYNIDGNSSTLLVYVYNCDHVFKDNLHTMSATISDRGTG